MQLKEEDLNIIRQTLLYNAERLPLSCGNFYVKESCDKPISMYSQGIKEPDIVPGIKELAAQIIATDLGLIAPKCFLAKIDDNYYILSEDLNNYGVFITMDSFLDFHYVDNSLILIWNYIENIEKLPNRFDLMIDLVKTYLLDMFIANWDRNMTNYGVLVIHENNRLGLIDHEYCLSLEFMATIRSYIVDERENDVKKIFLKKQKDIEYFLTNYSPLLTQIFIDYYNFLTPKYFKNVLKRIEKEHKLLGNSLDKKIVIPNKKELVETYNKNYDIIRETMKTHYGTRKRLLKHP